MLLPEFGNLLCSIVYVSEFYAAKHVVLNLCLFVAPYLGKLLKSKLVTQMLYMNFSISKKYVYLCTVCIQCRHFLSNFHV
jgi:hypothetical protein